MPIERPGSRRAERNITLPGGYSKAWQELRNDRVELHTEYKTGGESGSGGAGSWPKCRMPECWGAAISADGYCICHVRDDTRATYVTDAIAKGNAILFQGCIIDASIATWIQQTFLEKNATVDAFLSFAGATITHTLEISHVKFSRDLDFRGCTFLAHWHFVSCVFEKYILLSFCDFDSGAAYFTDCNMKGPLDLSFCYGERVSFGLTGCHQIGPLHARGICLSIQLRNSVFGSVISLNHSESFIIVENCQVKGEIDVSHTKCPSFQVSGLVAEGCHHLGPMTTSGYTKITHSKFLNRMTMVIDAKTVDLTGTRFTAGGVLQFAGASINLYHVISDSYLVISGDSTSGERTFVTDVRNSDVGSMGFKDVNMSRCLFYNSRNLANIWMDATATFLRTPLFYARRRYIADEAAWRVRRSGFRSWGWTIAGTRLEEAGFRDEEESFVVIPPLTPGQVAITYRELRRSLESKSNQPAASDFYYGEMEMRRLDPSADFFERLLLWLYWAISGYGLRAWRSLFWLVAVVIGSSYAIFKTDGDRNAINLADSLLIVLKAITPGFQKNDALSYLGSLVQVALTLVGPLLVGFTLFALRARVKR